MNFDKKYSEYLNLIENNLEKLLDSVKEKSIVSEAMRYSLMNGGKRVRPVLALAFCEMLNGDINEVLPFACAIEMIHTYSLIHDDLPCMDNDDMRRGKPSCHKKYGEEYALLAGDGLLNLAFETIFGFYTGDEKKALECGKIISAASGISGMIGGQAIDLLSENKDISLEELKKLHSLKTGAMITAPCLIATVCASGSDKDFKNAKAYGEIIGLQFQIVDDILDKTSSAEELGKPIGSDEQNNKSTYVSLLGLEKAKEQSDKLLEEALSVLDEYPESNSFLKEFSFRLSSRNK